MVACAAVTGIVEIPPEPPSPDPGMRGERESLLGWLWYQRAAFARKCVGLTREQLVEMSIPPSRLSLLGLAPLERDGTLSLPPRCRRGTTGADLLHGHRPGG